jgi:aminoglycoside/choline kinase family phosphotransferase
MEDKIKQLFTDWAGEEPVYFEALPESGSIRKYFRIKGVKKQAIAAFNPDLKENDAFFYFTDYFLKNGLNVPEIFAKNAEEGIYLLQDLGDRTFFSLLTDVDRKKGIPGNIIKLYEQSLTELLKFQVVASKNLDYSVCYPRAAFDRQSMQWDLNYFKYYFLKLAGISFHEQKLEDDFNKLMDYLEGADSDYFMFRDFQARNVMIYDDKPFFIDYQGGRKGPLQYDLASMLFQAKARLPQSLRVDLLNFYISNLKEYAKVNDKEFVEYYYGFVLIRTLQVLGAYGYRGYFERKPHFVESIEYAVVNLKWFVENVNIPVDTPELTKCLNEIIRKDRFKQKRKSSNLLTVEINSFSFKKEIPEDKSGNGGGFIFDCRALPNPGRYEEYKKLTGKDKPVIDFLKKEPEVLKFLNNVYEIVDQSVDNYIERGFGHLMVNFGCTGGQHRSVYSAENLYAHLKSKYEISLKLSHKIIDKW